MGDRSADPEHRGRDPRPPRDAGLADRPLAGQLAEEALKQYVEYESWKADKIREAVRRADAGDFASDQEMEAVFDRYRRAVDASG